MMSKSTTKALLGFLAGAAAGTITGVLFAPDKGTKTRKKIKNKVKRTKKDLKDNISDSVSDLKEFISSFVEDVKGRFESLEAQMEEKAKEAEKSATGTTNKK
ncbi:MAG: YtxH domain-containing protein [Bacteroidales bacterium]